MQALDTFADCIVKKTHGAGVAVIPSESTKMGWSVGESSLVHVAYKDPSQADKEAIEIFLLPDVSAYSGVRESIRAPRITSISN